MHDNCEEWAGETDDGIEVTCGYCGETKRWYNARDKEWVEGSVPSGATPTDGGWISEVL